MKEEDYISIELKSKKFSLQNVLGIIQLKIKLMIQKKNEELKNFQEKKEEFTRVRKK